MSSSEEILRTMLLENLDDSSSYSTIQTFIVNEDIPEEDSLKFSMTIMAFPKGSLVTYKNYLYLVESLTPYPLKLVLRRIGYGGYKRVRPSRNVVRIIETENQIFFDIKDIPVSVAQKYVEGYYRIVGVEGTITEVVLTTSESTVISSLKPIGILAKNYCKEFSKLNVDSKLSFRTFSRKRFCPLFLVIEGDHVPRKWKEKIVKETTKNPNRKLIVVSYGERPKGHSAIPKKYMWLPESSTWIFLISKKRENIDQIITIIGLGANQKFKKGELLVPEIL
jgi:hypothetical protein